MTKQMQSFRAFRIHQDGKQVAARLETIALSDLSPGEVVVKVSYSSPPILVSVRKH